MGRHKEVAMGPADRLRQAARIFAAGAIRAALREQASLPGHRTRQVGPDDGTPTRELPETRRAA